MSKIDPRNGAPKKLDPLKIHDGHYHFVKNGVLVRALSKTQSAVLDGGLPVDTLTKSAIEKRFYSERAQPVINHRSRSGPSPSGDAILQDAASRIRDVSAPGAVRAKR
jgi:hypothetical protein